MAITVTENLKLRIADSLTEDSQYNLRRLDELGGVIPLSTGTQTVPIKSAGNISLEPESPDLGGGGSSTGIIALNSAFLTGVKIQDSFTITNTASKFNTIFQTSNSQTATVTYTLPPNDGAIDQVLGTDGTGVLSWVDKTAGSVSTLEETWSIADGLTKTITHNFNSYSVIVQVLDENNDTVDVCVSRPTLDTVQVARSENPDSGDWTVLLIKL